jgi:hypothetical protein
MFHLPTSLSLLPYLFSSLLFSQLSESFDVDSSVIALDKLA